MSKRTIVIAIVSTIVLFLMIGACQALTSNGSNPAAQPQSTPTFAPTATLPPQPQKWVTTHTYTGNGIEKTGIFTVGDDWKILYTCSPENVDGVTSDGILQVTVYNADNSPLDVAINATCKASQATTTGETEEHTGGSIYLDINALGDWKISISELR